MVNRHRPATDAQTHDVPEQWQEREFVDKWVTRDDGRQDQRDPLVRATVEAAPFPPDRAIRILDVGAGYGILSRQLLERYPHAQVTLQDVSEPMFDHARRRLADYDDRTTYVNSDFSKRDWAEGLDGPFDLVVSAIAIHNMYSDDLIAHIYRDIHDLTAEGGMFANLDYAAQAGGVETHVRWLEEAGFAHVEAVPQNERTVLLKASRWV